MRRYNIYGKTVQIKLRYSDFHTISRARTLAAPTCATRELQDCAVQLLNGIDRQHRAVRLLGMGVANLTTGGERQLTLFDREEQAKTQRLDQAADQIKDRFGSAALTRGTSLEHKIRHRPDPRVND